MGLRNVVTLDLNSVFIEFLSRGREMLPASLPSSYCSLKHLCLRLFPTCIHVQVIQLLLSCYPHLQTLEITVDSQEYKWHFETLRSMNITGVEDHWQLEELPGGDILNHLRMVKIKEFEGRESEIKLVRFLLENAKFLEKMKFSYTYNEQENADIQRKIREMLSAFAGIAPIVIISLSVLFSD
ncbi:hypothetical protein AQUCO_05700072v1 [Aquilegia coerulea]|uniref:FBD domain-containing protein n=1 Tax=Aquilegia coerulea TaxID=218851 RepID=A0A2G5CFL6_AQUCA|nr:hypothetical protein AQUCO_05700072v1 [Aquilegia coerulea]